MVQIIVFVDNPTTQRQTDVVKWFTAAGYCPLVDSVHGKDYHWFKNQFIKNYRLYKDGATVYSFVVEDLDAEMNFSPDFAIIFNEDDEEVGDEAWARIRRFILGLFAGNDGGESVDDILPKPVLVTQDDFSLPEVKDDGKDEDCYGFKTTFIEDKNLMLYQITRPYTDLPYTTIVRDFKNVGHRPFFSALFVCTSWGVSRHDVPFLGMLWKHLGMVGEFDIDELLKEATEACYPSENKIPKAEPEVYRRGIDEVMKTLKAQDVGEQCAHDDFIPQHVKVRFE